MNNMKSVPIYLKLLLGLFMLNDSDLKKKIKSTNQKLLKTEKKNEKKGKKEKVKKGKKDKKLSKKELKKLKKKEKKGKKGKKDKKGKKKDKKGKKDKKDKKDKSAKKEKKEKDKAIASMHKSPVLSISEQFDKFALISGLCVVFFKEFCCIYF